MVAAYFFLHKKLPQGQEGQKAEQIAQKMLEAVNKMAWDTTHIIQFTFRGEHDHIWDKKRHFAQTEWADYKAIFDVNTAKGTAWKNGQKIDNEIQAKEIILTAWGYFLNDSYWLNPMVKIYDKGVRRSVVQMPNGKEGLLITHDGGGITPGDSYLWFLDENHIPTAWQMWVNIIPIGGIETTWEDWITLPTGAKIAKQHQLAIGNIELTNIKSASDWNEFGTPDPFASL